MGRDFSLFVCLFVCLCVCGVCLSSMVFFLATFSLGKKIIAGKIRYLFVIGFIIDIFIVFVSINKDQNKSVDGVGAYVAHQFLI